MNYRLGLLRAKNASADSAYLAALEPLARMLAANLDRERLFGSTEQIRNEQAQIVSKLNSLVLAYTHTSFNSMCIETERRP